MPEHSHSAASIDPHEVEKFSRMADEWWDEGGKFKPLHRFNPVRIAYIRDKVAAHYDRNPLEPLPLKGIRILDIGCGGGLLAEPLTRLGADVTGVDASQKNIHIASLHAQAQGLSITYLHSSAEELAEDNRQFDVVLNMEVIEHVADVGSFTASCCRMVKPGGVMVVATLNRTAKSFLLAIVGAEYILRWLPRGTHQWEKFLRPSEIENYLREGGLVLKELQGVSFSPLRDTWALSSDTAVNYMMMATKAR